MTRLLTEDTLHQVIHLDKVATNVQVLAPSASSVTTFPPHSGSPAHRRSSLPRGPLPLTSYADPDLPVSQTSASQEFDC